MEVLLLAVMWRCVIRRKCRASTIRINVVQPGCNPSNNVVSFSHNVVLRRLLFSLNVVSEKSDVVGSRRLYSQFPTTTASRREISSSCHRIQRSKNLGPAPYFQLRVFGNRTLSITLARSGSSLMPSSRKDPEICARHNLGSSRPARRLPQCTLRRNLRSTAQPQKTKTLRASKALGLRL